MATTVRQPVRARRFNNATYIRKEDLIAWFTSEAQALCALGKTAAAAQTESLLQSLRSVN